MFWLKGCLAVKVTCTRIQTNMGAMLTVSSAAITVSRPRVTPLFLPLIRKQGRRRVLIYERLLQ
jgi:hypothetical protein